MNRRLGRSETAAIRSASSLPGFTDLVCYWFDHAHEMLLAGQVKRVGLVATNSIRKNTNLPVLQRIARDLKIFRAWSEEKWTVDGAAVDVSLICFAHPDEVRAEPMLNDLPVPGIFADLTSDVDLTAARPLPENRGWALLGIQKSGPFDITGDVARTWMSQPPNTNNKPNGDVLRPYWNGDDITGRPRDMYFIDLPLKLSETEASEYAAPFHHLKTTPDDDGKLLLDLRLALGDRAGPRWWEPHWPRPEMRSRIAGLPRFIVTPETSEHRIFAWMTPPTLPDKNLIVIPRSDDFFFGLLHSRFHAQWALRKGSDLQDRPRYTHTSIFATFPFPEGYGPGDAPPDSSDALGIAVSEAASDLNRRRENYLYPAGHFKAVDENKPWGPRMVPVGEEEAVIANGRTMSKLYGDQPEWLVLAHRTLDQAVAALYGWPSDITDEDALKRLLELNLTRLSRQPTGKRPRARRE